MDNAFEHRQPELSFCIPVKNRFADIQATLRQNLDDNRADEAQIEFILLCFDDYHYVHHDVTDSSNVRQWVEMHCANELASGYLRFYHQGDLAMWHFGKAKNAFKPLIKGKIYASLDADNFTGKNAGRHIIEVFRQYDYQCVFHQFQGNYGDGTCGRIALKREHYLDWGYDENFLPRQWDELDAILSTLVRQSGTTYVCYSGPGKNILRRSYPIRRYLKDHNITFKQQEIADPDNHPAPDLDPSNQSEDNRSAAIGQHDPAYVGQDIQLRLASIYNNHLSLIKNTDKPELKARYESELIACQLDMLQSISAERLQSWFLKPLFRQHHEDTPFKGTTLLFGWIDHQMFSPYHYGSHKKDHHNIDHSSFAAWHQHHRKLGVEKFFLVVAPATRFDGFDSSEFPDVQLLQAATTLASSPYSPMFLLEILLKVYGAGKHCYLLGDYPWVPVNLSELAVPAGKDISAAILSRDSLVQPLLSRHLYEYVQTVRSQSSVSSHRLVKRISGIVQRLSSALKSLTSQRLRRLVKPGFNDKGAILLYWQDDMSLACNSGKIQVNAKQQQYSYVRFMGVR